MVVGGFAGGGFVVMRVIGDIWKIVTSEDLVTD